MNNPDNYIIQTVRNSSPYGSRDEAMEALDNFTQHRIGQIITLLYRIPPDIRPDRNLHDVHVLVAVGIKNANECGTSGTQNPDRWDNKYYPEDDYPNGPCGREFYRIISDTTERDDNGVLDPNPYDPGQGGDYHCEPLHNTTVTTVNKTHVVKNPYDHDITLEDPFIFKPLDEDSCDNINED